MPLSLQRRARQHHKYDTWCRPAISQHRMGGRTWQHFLTSILPNTCYTQTFRKSPGKYWAHSWGMSQNHPWRCNILGCSRCILLSMMSTFQQHTQRSCETMNRMLYPQHSQCKLKRLQYQNTYQDRTQYNSIAPVLLNR